MTPEVKLATLASANATLQSYFGAPPIGINGFRWFDKQLAQNAVKKGPCVRSISISSAPLYEQAGLNSMNPIRFQIDVFDLDPERARAAASAVVAFMETADFSSDDQFGSPVLTPKHHPNLLLSQRGGMDAQPQPPVHFESLDYRIFNKEN